jgi:enoyl-CoA hydratase
MKTDVLTTSVIDKIAVVALGSPKKVYFDMAMGDALTDELQAFAGDPGVRVVIITGGTPGYFNGHFDIPALIDIAEQIRASGRQWPDNASDHGGFFDKAMAICETMPKPVIAATSGTALAGAFESTLACDSRIAEDGDYLIGLPETELGLRPGASGTQRLPRTVGMATALWHILMGKPLSPREAETRGFVHETVKGKAIDRAMEIAKHLSKHPPESAAYIKRLVRSANETPLADGMALEEIFSCGLVPQTRRLPACAIMKKRKVPRRSLEFRCLKWESTRRPGLAWKRPSSQRRRHECADVSGQEFDQARRL